MVSRYVQPYGLNLQGAAQNGGHRPSPQIHQLQMMHAAPPPNLQMISHPMAGNQQPKQQDFHAAMTQRMGPHHQQGAGPAKQHNQSQQSQSIAQNSQPKQPSAQPQLVQIPPPYRVHPQSRGKPVKPNGGFLSVVCFCVS